MSDSVQTETLRLRMPAESNSSLWSKNTITGEVTGYLPEIIEELFKVIELNYTMSLDDTGAYNELGIINM